MKRECTLLALSVIIMQLAAVLAVVRIVSVQPITSKYGPAKIMRDGEILWTEMVNARGGFLINGTFQSVELISIDVGASTDAEMIQKTIKAVETVANGTYGEVHAMISPYTTFLTEAHAIAAESRKILSCAPGAASPAIFECDENMYTPCTSNQGRRFEYLVGTQSSAATIFPPAMALAKVKGARTVGIFRETGADEKYFSALRTGALSGAADNRMDVVLDVTVPFISTIDDTAKTNLKGVIAQLMQAKPDLVVGGVLQAGCLAFIEAAKEMNYTANAFLLSICAASPDKFREVLGESGRYVMGPVLWDRRLTGRVYHEDGSSPLHYFPMKEDSSASPQLFYNAFVDRFNYKPSYHAASQFSCGLALQFAAENSRDLDAELMRFTINRVNLVTFYGQLQFNTFGQIVETGLGSTVQFNNHNEDAIVLPIAASATDLIYPMPLWEERQEQIQWYATGTEQGIVIVAGVGVLACIALMALFAAWRQRPQIIASSLLFVELIIFGAAMMYASLFFWVLETTTAMCNLRYWLIGVGFVLMFSALLTKAWRVWRIFHERSLKMLKLNNAYLLRIMAVAIGIEVVVLTVWSAAFTPQVETIIVDEYRPLLNYRTCTSDMSLPFAIVLIVYKGSLIIAGIVLGFSSRKIRSEYNESKFILIAMYNITFAALILLVLFAIDINDRSIDFIIRSIAILWGTTATLCILLIPKIYFVVSGSNDPTKRRGLGDWSTPQASMYVPETYEGVQEQLEWLAKREQLLRERLVEIKSNERKENFTSRDKTTPTRDNSVGQSSRTSANLTSVREENA